MDEIEFVGKVNRFGSEYRVYLNPADSCIRIKDEEGNELKCSSKKVGKDEDILAAVPKILKSVGL